MMCEFIMKLFIPGSQVNDKFVMIGLYPVNFYPGNKAVENHAGKLMPRC